MGNGDPRVRPTTQRWELWLLPQIDYPAM